MQTGWMGAEKPWKKPIRRPEEKFFNIFSKKNLHVLKKVPTFPSLGVMLYNNRALSNLRVYDCANKFDCLKF